MMKPASLLFPALACLISVGSAAENMWYTDYDAAVSRARAENKSIILDFTGSDWCGWCTKMDQTTFIDPSIVEYINENYYAVKFDAEQAAPIEFMGHTFVNQNPDGPRKGTHQLAQALLQGKMSYPSYVFMNEKNQVLTIVPGYAQAKEFLPILKYFGTDAFLTTSWEDYSKNQDK